MFQKIYLVNLKINNKPLKIFHKLNIEIYNLVSIQ